MIRTCLLISGSIGWLAIPLAGELPDWFDIAQRITIIPAFFFLLGYYVLRIEPRNRESTQKMATEFAAALLEKDKAHIEAVQAINDAHADALRDQRADHIRAETTLAAAISHGAEQTEAMVRITCLHVGQVQTKWQTDEHSIDNIRRINEDIKRLVEGKRDK